MNRTNEGGDGPVSRGGAEERDYLLHRASQHAQQAEDAQDPATKTVHLQLRQLYEDCAAGIDMVDPD